MCPYKIHPRVFCEAINNIIDYGELRQNLERSLTQLSGYAWIWNQSPRFKSWSWTLGKFLNLAKPPSVKWEC